MAKKLTEKEKYQRDIKDLTRKILQGVQLADIDSFVENLSPEERADFLRWCSQVTNDKWFDRTFSALYYPHVMASVNQADNYDVVSFHRATINGVSLVKEFFEKQNIRYVEEQEKRTPKFDPQRPFSEVDGEDDIIL